MKLLSARTSLGQAAIRDLCGSPELTGAANAHTELMDGDTARRWLPERPVDGHKGTFGRDGIVGGSVGFTGAPVLAARGALRSGAGLVTILSPETVYPIVAVKCDEAMVRPIPPQQELLAFVRGLDALLVGPGMGRDPESRKLALLLARAFDGPLVLDADGINTLENHIDVLDARKGRVTVLTPHDGEFARLGGDLSDGDRVGAARRFAAAHGCCLVLKGHRTVTACPDGHCLVNPTGNSGMAVGGSGDVLAGVILSLLGQGLEPQRAAALGVWLHGRAGDIAAGRLGEYGMLPTDLAEALPFALLELTQSKHKEE